MIKYILFVTHFIGGQLKGVSYKTSHNVYLTSSVTNCYVVKTWCWINSNNLIDNLTLEQHNFVIKVKFVTESRATAKSKNTIESYYSSSVESVKFTLKNKGVKQIFEKCLKGYANQKRLGTIDLVPQNKSLRQKDPLSQYTDLIPI